MGKTLMQSWRRSKAVVAGILAVTALVAFGCYWQAAERRTLPGALAFDPERNPDLTENYLKGLDFIWANGPPGRWRGFLECHTKSVCDSGTVVEFQITAEKNARTTPMVDALGGPRPERGGYIVAQLINLDPTHEYRPFGMAAHDTAYLWVGPTKNGSKRFVLYRIPKGKPPILIAKAGKASYCPRGTQPVTDIHVPPERCAELRQLYPLTATKTGAATDFGSGSAFRVASSTPGIPALISAMSHADGLWVSCSGGCCEASEWSLQ